MIDTLVWFFHRYFQYLLGINWLLQFDSGRAYNRLKQICRIIAWFEYTRVTTLDNIQRVSLSLSEPLNRILLSRKHDSFMYPDTRQSQRWRTVRLLRLHPGQHREPLVGTLTSFTTVTIYLWSWSFDMPAYDAVSYCWGSGKSTETIVLNGRPLNITASLVAALQHLRLPDQDRHLWIDQICIDQRRVRDGDYVEKTTRSDVWVKSTPTQREPLSGSARVLTLQKSSSMPWNKLMTR